MIKSIDLNQINNFIANYEVQVKKVDNLIEVNKDIATWCSQGYRISIFNALLNSNQYVIDVQNGTKSEFNILVVLYKSDTYTVVNLTTDTSTLKTHTLSDIQASKERISFQLNYMPEHVWFTPQGLLYYKINWISSIPILTLRFRKGTTNMRNFRLASAYKWYDEITLISYRALAILEVIQTHVELDVANFDVIDDTFIISELSSKTNETFLKMVPVNELSLKNNILYWKDWFALELTDAQVERVTSLLDQEISKELLAMIKLLESKGFSVTKN